MFITKELDIIILTLLVVKTEFFRYLGLELRLALVRVSLTINAIVFTKYIANSIR